VIILFRLGNHWYTANSSMIS